MKKWMLLFIAIISVASYAQVPEKNPDTTKIQLGKYELIVIEDSDGNTTVKMNVEDEKGNKKEKVYKISENDEGEDIVIIKDENGEQIIRPEDGEDRMEEKMEQAQDRMEEAQDLMEEKMEQAQEKMEEAQDRMEETQERMEETQDGMKAKRKLIIKRKKRKYKLYSNWGGLSVGYETFYDNDRNLSDAGIFNTDRSYSLRWEFYRLSMHLGSPYVSLTSGLSYGAAFMPLKANAELQSDDNSTGIVVNDSKNYSKNKLNYSFIEIPVFLEIFTGTHRNNNLRISAGLINKFRLKAKAKYEYVMDGKAYDTSVRDDFNLFKYSPELSARIGYRGIGIFANAGLYPFFKKGKGPDVKSFTVGLNFSFPVLKTGRSYRG